MSDGPRPRIAFKTLGCKVNRVESDTIAAELLGSGFELSAEADAQVIVINTCTVTGEADAKARKAVRHALKASPGAAVVVTGCLAAVDAPSLLTLDARVIVEADKGAVAARVSERLGGSARAGGAAAAVTRAGAQFRTRAAIKVQDGCDNRCAYCIVPVARGVPRSVPLASVLAEADALVAAGTREIVLTGINLGRYSDDGAHLPGLVRAIARTGVDRVRLSSIEPPDITPELLEVLASEPAVCPHLHVPLQSGSDAVLSAMGRFYSSAVFEQVIREARESLPHLAVSTDVIAGLPGEAEEHHRATVELCERVGFSRLHVFRYSERAGTAAAAMTQVDSATRSRRAEELRALGAELADGYTRQRLGSEAELLVETVDQEGVTGTTRDYLRVRVLGATEQPGTLLAVRLERLSADTTLGVVVGPTAAV